MLKASYDHFSVALDGQIYFQEKANNPLPGVPVARLLKGEGGLFPSVETLPDVQCDDIPALLAHLEGFVRQHVAEKLPVLDELSKHAEFDFEGYDVQESEKEAVAAIAKAVYDGMGIVDRASIQSHIEQLTPESRRYLRSKRIRLGPILAFQPDLNKPAAVRLRGALWAIFYGQSLPVTVPPDGSVSIVLDELQQENKAFYKAVGYPVYGNRAIRIDMLDRVINEVYDSAKEGKFQAQHKMAEWLGCSIPDLYGILESLGFKKISDPADEEQEGAEEVTQDKNEVKAEDGGVKSESAAQSEQKPELATFVLKRGKLSGRKPPFNKSKAKAPQKKHKGKRNKSTHRPKKQTSFGPKPDEKDSPFAVLAALKGDAG